MDLSQSLQNRLLTDEVLANAERLYQERDLQRLKEYLFEVLSELLKACHVRDDLLKQLMYERIWEGFEESENFPRPRI